MMKLDDEYLALTARLTQDIKSASYSQLNLTEGSRHLEIGSGNGIDSLALAAANPGSYITGIDLNEEIVAIANLRAEEQGLDNVMHITGDAATRNFPENFHSMRAERVFQHLDNSRIQTLVQNLAEFAEPGCVFSMVGIDWETLSCTLAPKHLETFRLIKQFLIEVSNISFIHSAIEAFESNGFTTGEIETYIITTTDFQVAMTAFNLENIASELELDRKAIQNMRKDFINGKHYFSVGGCSAPFVFRNRV